MSDTTGDGPPSAAVTPLGLNHLVLNVRDIEASHHFWTEMLGFRQVGALGRMRFYSGERDGRLHHHDIALVENPNLPPGFLDRPNLFDAVKQQLGLKLEPQKGPVEFYVIDGAQKPEKN